MTGPVGRTLGQYQILDEIGQGGMANVYRAVQPSIGREVAIKVLPAHFLQDRTFLERFNREVQVVARLQHPHILQVYDFGQQDGLPYIVMAYLRGGSLADLIQQSPGGMALGEVARLVGQMAAGLDFAHEKGIVHRDFKPSNVLLDEKGNAYLSDFGIARVAEATAQLTGSGMIGTPSYMAPEMTQEHSTTPLVDVYALGVTVYQMLAGRLPYQADTPMGTALAHITRPIPDARQQRPDLPEAMQQVIERGMAKDPTARYQSAGTLAADLHAAVGAGLRPALASTPIPPTEHLAAPTPPELPTMDYSPPTEWQTPPGPVTQVERPVGKRRKGMPGWVLIGGGVVGMGLLAVIAVGLLLMRGVGDDETTPEATQIEETQDVGATGTQPEVVVAPTATDEPIDGPTPTPGQIENVAYVLAEAGVTRNDLWTPYIEEFDGVPMALIPVGCFMMGSEDGYDDERPVHEVCFEEPFWIDVYEVTQAQFAALGGEATQASYFTGDNLPRENITWIQADAFCRKRGLRLPTEAEWEYVARGPDGPLYPWGNDFVEDNLVYDLNSSSTWAVGSRPGGVSWIGAFDLSGNVWEWVNDWYLDTYYSTLADGTVNPQGPSSGTFRVLRGGSWDNGGNNVRATEREGASSGNGLAVVGFRCARDY